MKRLSTVLTAFALTLLLAFTTGCGILKMLPVGKDGGKDQNAENTEQEPDDSDTDTASGNDGSGKEEADNTDPSSGDGENLSNGEDDEDRNGNEDDGSSGTEEISESQIMKERMSLSEAECRAKIELLRGNDPVLPPETEVLAEMGRCATFSGALNKQGVIFSKMDVYSKARLRWEIMGDILWEENAFSGAIETKESNGEYGADILFPAAETQEFFMEVYGEENYEPAEYEKQEDNYLLYSYGDGEGWEIVEHMQFFEDEDYYLMTGPAFYGDNGGASDFMGYADILFAKNPVSRYGVTLLFGRYREGKVDVSWAVASSELEGSKNKTYTAMNLVDGNFSTVWAEGVPGTGVGETVTLYLDGEQPVYGVYICNGYTADYDLFEKNGRLTEAEVDFGHGRTAKAGFYGYSYEGIEPQYLADLNRTKIELDEPVMTDEITIMITGAEKGTKYDDTCISEILVY